MNNTNASVIICGHKYLDYVDNIINNIKIIPQEWEIVFVDNNSNTNELRILKKNFSKSKIKRNIKFSHCAIAGVGPSRDYGFSLSVFDIIIYLDVDDYVLGTENLLKIVSEHINLNSSVTLSPCKYKVDSRSKPSYKPERPEKISLEKYLFNTGQYNIIVSRKMLNNISWGYYFCKAELAALFIIKCFQNNYKIYISNLSIFFYNEESTSSIIRSPINNSRCNELALIYLNTLQQIILSRKNFSLPIVRYKLILILKILYYGILISKQPYFYYDSIIKNKYLSIKFIYFCVLIKLYFEKLKIKIFNIIS